jgi:U3 small nucleolar RNA-associated protein 19
MSSHLPASIVASFIKRMARLSLTATPASILVALAFIYNLLKRHPSCMCLIHRDSASSNEPLLAAAAATPRLDPYVDDEADPALSRALDSSLWELQTLKSHYCPQVAKLARTFEKPFVKPEFPLADFLATTYTSVRVGDARTCDAMIERPTR